MRCGLEASTYVLYHANKVLERDEPNDLKLERLWHALTVLRASMLAGLLRQKVGNQVFSGPFKGMQLTPAVMTDVYGPVLTGHYEYELHDVFERIIAQPYKRILNIGCAFGYYSVGLALRMPQVTVDAFDIDQGEQVRCRDMAVLNNVQDRIHVGGEFRGEDFASYAKDKTLALVDIEGSELTLLDPERYPALKKLDMVVELHDVYHSSLSKIIPARFAATHEIEIIYNKPNMFDFGPVLGEDYFVNPLDSVIMTWENRAGPTPWAFMRAR